RGPVREDGPRHRLQRGLLLVQAGRAGRPGNGRRSRRAVSRAGPLRRRGPRVRPRVPSDGGLRPRSPRGDLRLRPLHGRLLSSAPPALRSREGGRPGARALPLPDARAGVRRPPRRRARLPHGRARRLRAARLPRDVLRRAPLCRRPDELVDPERRGRGGGAPLLRSPRRASPLVGPLRVPARAGYRVETGPEPRHGGARGHGMSPRVLVTGGAGFVGSHLVDRLLERGASVRILDNLDPQVHPDGRPPRWLSPAAELRIGDVRDADTLASALDGVDVVYHLAAAVGVGQSMYRIADYTTTNTAATATLLQTLVDRRVELERLVVASSMSIYGEGLYRRPEGTRVERVRRSSERLASRAWDPVDADGTRLEPLPTPEDKRLDPTSVYALTKADQERLALIIGEAYGIPTVALRFFNIYGPRQAL